jgi:hypothetical protein
MPPAFSRLAAASLTLLLAWPGSGLAQSKLELAVKAAYLAKFVPFIDWPDGVFANPGSPVNLCVLGGDPFGAALDRAAASTNGGRPLTVRRLASPDLAGSCQILYLAGGSTIPQGLKDRPVVTVTDAGGGGMITFVIEANHVRFDIDDDAASHSGLHISSKLLSLAHAVKRHGGAP